MSRFDIMDPEYVKEVASNKELEVLRSHLAMWITCRIEEQNNDFVQGRIKFWAAVLEAKKQMLEEERHARH